MHCIRLWLTVWQDPDAKLVQEKVIVTACKGLERHSISERRSTRLFYQGHSVGRFSGQQVAGSYKNSDFRSNFVVLVKVQHIYCTDVRSMYNGLGRSKVLREQACKIAAFCGLRLMCTKIRHRSAFYQPCIVAPSGRSAMTGSNASLCTVHTFQCFLPYRRNTHTIANHHCVAH